MGQIMATSQNNSGLPSVAKDVILARLEAPQFNPRTGQRESQPTEQTFTEAEFKQAQDAGLLDGYQIEILQHPDQFKAETGEAKRGLATGPLLGQANDATGPKGSIATTAATTLAHTQGLVDLQGDHILESTNQLSKPLGIKTEEGFTTPGTEGGNGVEGVAGIVGATTVTTATEEQPAAKLTVKQQAQARYKELYGEEADPAKTIPELQDLIKAKE